MHIIAQTGWGQEQDRRRAEHDLHAVKPVACAALANLPLRS